MNSVRVPAHSNGAAWARSKMAAGNYSGGIEMSLYEYVTLGRSGLRVSPLCLGAMTFGTEWGFGVDESASRSIFDRYIELGGNFVDTADGYTAGKSEEL